MSQFFAFAAALWLGMSLVLWDGDNRMLPWLGLCMFVFLAFASYVSR